MFENKEPIISPPVNTKTRPPNSVRSNKLLIFIVSSFDALFL